MTLTERFLNYVKISTASDESSETSPSTEKQYNMLNLLFSELTEAGFSDVRLVNGYVYAKLPSNTKKKCPKIGFIAHVDTSPDMSDENINPRILHYEGGDITLNEKLGIVMKETEFPILARYKGDDLVVTDGTTLLGADDKAGVSEIMDMAIRLKESGEEHGDILIGFTPDEEIGRGADGFDVASFGADYAYTVDGGTLGEIEYENFNAASVKITVSGKSIHPGSAKNQMVNAALVAHEIISMLPEAERPEHTEGYEGFYHLGYMNGTVEHAMLGYIIRDHDREKFEKRKAFIKEVCDFVGKKYPGAVECVITDSYYNMKEQILPCYYIIERLEEAMKLCDVKPNIVPIRGGTDGARLSFMGLPCPNICTGGENYHGKYEFASLQSMQKVSEILYKLCTEAVGK